jgi:hypothetical protein
MAPGRRSFTEDWKSLVYEGGDSEVLAMLGSLWIGDGPGIARQEMAAVVGHDVAHVVEQVGPLRGASGRHL